MNLQQIRYLCAVVDHGLNVSAAAEALFTSQPGISKQIRQLEDELGLAVFVRQGKRLTSMTPAGEVVVATARRALREVVNMKRVADEFRAEDSGTLAIATTHTQARYVLPNVLQEFAARYPKVRVLLHQGNPRQVAEQASSGFRSICSTKRWSSTRNSFRCPATPGTGACWCRRAIRWPRPRAR